MAWEEIGFTSSIVQLSSSAPADIGTTAAAGSGSTGARSDHVHKIGTGAINASTMFASGVVNATALASNAVTSDKIASGAVTSGKIGTGAISSSTMFASGVVDSTALASGAVTSGKIGTGAINASNLFAAGVVDATALASNAITNAKIASSAVTTAKINIDANLAFNQKQAVGMVLHSASTAPNSGSEVAGQIYYDTVTKTVKIWVP